MMLSSLMPSLFPLFLSLLAPLSHATDFRYCDNDGNSTVKVYGVQIDPLSPKLGDDIAFKISATTGEQITSGEFYFDVKFIEDGAPFRFDIYGVCDWTDRCPLNGDFLVPYFVTVPTHYPAGLYTLRMRLYTNKGGLGTCIQFDFNIGSA